MRALLQLVMALALVASSPSWAETVAAPHPATATPSTPPASTGPAAPTSRPGSRLSCITLALATGAATSLPMVIPLWFSGAAKGVAAYNGAVDLMQRAEKARIGPPMPLRDEQAMFGILVGMALGGATTNTVVHLPPFLFFGTAVPLVMVMDQDGVFSDMCGGKRGAAAQGTPLLKPRHLAFMSLLALVALVPLPIILAPTVVATGIILMALGLAPTIQRIPGLGLVDMFSAFKRAGLLEAATYPALYVSAAAGSVLLLQVMLLAWHFAPVLSGPAE